MSKKKSAVIKSQAIPFHFIQKLTYLFNKEKSLFQMVISKTIKSKTNVSIVIARKNSFCL